MSRPRNSSHYWLITGQTPDGTSPSLHTHYRRFVTTTGRSALLTRSQYSAARGLAACRSPSGSRSQPTGTHLVSRSSPVPLQSPSQARAIFMPGTARAVDRYPSDSSRNSINAPVLMPPGLTTRPRWFTLVRLLDSHLPPLTTAFPRRSPPWLIHHSSSWWFDTSTCMPIPKDLPSSPQQHGHIDHLSSTSESLRSLQDTLTL